VQHLFVAENNLVVEGTSDYAYLKIISDHLASKGRAHLDPKWSIVPVGGADLSEGKTPDLQHLVITMDNQPPVLAVSALFSTEFTANGHIVGPTLNVLPRSETSSVAVISSPGEQVTTVRTALANVFDADEKTLKYELAKLIVGRVENFVLSGTS
jgi:hypothetical protein